MRPDAVRATESRGVRPLPHAANSSSSATHSLFTYVQPVNAAALDAALPAPARAMHYVRLNPALLAG